MKKKDFSYLLFNYHKVNKFLSSDNLDNKNVEEFLDTIVAFCVVVERALKAKLYKRHPILIIESKVNEDIIKNVSQGGKIERTAKLIEILNRFKYTFPKDLSENEQAMILKYHGIRCNLTHDYELLDSFSYELKEEIRIMSTVWVKISKIVKQLFGRKIGKIKQLDKFTESQLEKILREEVERMIKRPIDAVFRRNIDSGDYMVGLYPFNKCPRCGADFFGLEVKTSPLWYDESSNITSMYVGEQGLHRCLKCNLELTPRQYEIAKKILVEEKL